MKKLLTLMLTLCIALTTSRRACQPAAPTGSGGI